MEELLTINGDGKIQLDETYYIWGGNINARVLGITYNLPAGHITSITMIEACGR